MSAEQKRVWLVSWFAGTKAKRMNYVDMRFRLQLKMHAVYSVAYYEKVLVVVMFENKMLI